MTSRTDPATAIKRARPYLGTVVSISVGGVDETRALAAIESGFAAIADNHRLMSFHEADSDISRLNRHAHQCVVSVDRRTFAVLRQSADLSLSSGGVFDITVAARLVGAGFLPRPDGAPGADPAATWRDIELNPPDGVRFHRPLWIDLGGIAKGYAVDRAFEAMELPRTARVSVNAGGDLRVGGPVAERVLLRAPIRTGEGMPVVEIENGSLASSAGREQARLVDGRKIGPHLNGRGGRAGTQTFVSVAAEDCMIADALTKIVLVRGVRAAPVLRRYDATAYWRNGRGVWSILGRAQ